MKNQEEEVRRLQMKCNIQLDQLDNVLREKATLREQLERLEIQARQAINPLEAEMFLPGAAEKYYSVFCHTIEQMIQLGYVIQPIIETDKTHRNIEVGKFREVRARLYPDLDDREFLRFCLAFGLIQRAGTQNSGVYRRRQEEADAGMPVRVYRISTELLAWFYDGRINTSEVMGRAECEIE